MSSSEVRNSGMLQRGRACVTCRRRKIKCDGVRPACGQCTAAQWANDCEYKIGQQLSESETLEENISRLEARLLELQNPVQPESAMRLRQPYTHNPGSTAPRSSEMPLNLSQEPSSHWRERLLDNFLPYASEFGFFLDANRFRSSALLELPAGDPSRPLPALLYSIYLMGIYLSPDRSLLEHEDRLLDIALHEVSHGLSNNHPKRVLHGIQAEAILTCYFISHRRFVEGKYHLTAAVALALGAGLHQVSSPRSRQYSTGFSSAHGAIDQGEKILGFWTVFTLDSIWASVGSTDPNVEFMSGRSYEQLYTPWPLDPNDYEQDLLLPDASQENTLHAFLSRSPTSDARLSPRGLLARAAFLFHRATKLARSWGSEMTPDQFYAFSNEFTTLDTLIDDLTASSLPFIEDLQSPNLERIRVMVIGYSLLHSATIRIHNTLAQGSHASQRKRLSAAKEMFNLVTSLNSWNLTHLNSIIGVTWLDASLVIINEITSSRSRPRGSSTRDASPESLFQDLQRGLVSMRNYTMHSRFINHQVGKIQEAYDARFTTITGTSRR